jgi:hypothetical protein
VLAAIQTASHNTRCEPEGEGKSFTLVIFRL